jgi:glycosyltransferase involved in cell wall biosynthesis
VVVQHELEEPGPAERSPTITVVTPTYNRGYVLERVYQSLLTQTFQDLEWIVVDDGSTDGTEALVAGWIAEGKLDLTYRRQENTGQYAAVNRGVEIARGEFITLLDSDDWFLPDTLQALLDIWYGIPEADRPGFSGAVGLCAYEDGRIVGDEYPEDPLDCDQAELYYLHGVQGDKHSLLRTEVLKAYPFPFEGEVVWPGIVWNRMALKYKERHVNRVVKILDYQDTGLSNRALEIQVGSPLPMKQYYLEELRLPHRLPLRRRLRTTANYSRWSLHCEIGLGQQFRDAPSKLGWAALLPVGVAVYLNDRRRYPAAWAARRAKTRLARESA